MRSAVCSLFFILILAPFFAKAQGTLEIIVSNPEGKVLKGVEVYLEPESEFKKTSRDGVASFSTAPGQKTISLFYAGYRSAVESINFSSDTSIAFTLLPLRQNLSEVVVENDESRNFGLRTMRSIEGTAIYAGKKNEVLLPDEINANKAVNSARQVYARIPGVNVWESDGAGIQLGIGVRGLSPNRTANINVRQNGYDISADALGYPESYYTPPMEAVERIEFVRGAASLQYGTQFGGMMNFRLKQGPEGKPFEFKTRQTGGSYGLYNSFNSIGGTKGKWNYYAFHQYKRGDGWRENSGFEVQTAYARLAYSLTENWTISGEYTHMSYLAQQPGGLTDDAFEENPRQSLRDRNWFKVNWNLAAVKLYGHISNKTTADLRVFGLMAERQALGFLGLPNRSDDPSSPRDLIKGSFENVGAEGRLLHRFTLAGKRNIALVGFRAYRGNTDSKQGRANTSDRPEFYFQNIDALEGSDYQFDNMNYAVFLEDVFYISDKMTLTPGLRLEFIQTGADGYYTNTVTDQVGNEIERIETRENRERSRSFLLAGIGWSYKMTDAFEIYANYSQNYRAINFSDIRIQNPSLRIDPDIQDERGYNTDIGIRGGTKRLHYDVSGYYLSYRDRIGAIQRRDPDTFQFYRLRNNIADSYAIGAEGYLEGVIYRSRDQEKCNISAFANASFTEARYTAAEDNAVNGNRVELTPMYTLRSGLRGSFSNLSVTLQVSHIAKQFTDATNAISTPSSINGEIPAYTVADVSAAYQWKRYRIEFGVNNFTDEKYFTRRAVGYPGPGIIPSDGIGGYITLEARF